MGVHKPVIREISGKITNKGLFLIVGYFCNIAAFLITNTNRTPANHFF